MSLRNPDPPPGAAPIPWPARAAGRRSKSSAAVAGVAGALALLLALWAVPPALDWGRFRDGIAAIAAAQLGRPVAISGEVTLRLLPEAVLTATGVELPDQGDGVSAALSSLRLQVAVLPLLTGRIVPRDLVLGAPVVQLPWPLPGNLARPGRGRAPAFAAHIENGTLRIGQVQVTGINAGIHDGPEPAAPPGLLPAANAAGLGAEGFAAFAGRNWRFTGALGLPDADGVSALDLAVRGQGAAARTNGTVQGTLAEGVVQGRLRAGGPDLSLLLPAARLAWQADAPFVASGSAIEAAAITMSLGGSPAEASLSMRIAAPARLDGRVHAASLDLDSWVRVLGAADAAARPLAARLAGRIDVTADTASLLGGTVAGLHGVLVSDGASLTLEHAGGILPGQARLDIGGAITRSAGLLRLDGPARLDAPDLRSTLRWVRSLAPVLFDALPPGVLARCANLTGTVSAGPHFLSVSGLAGQLGDARVTGGFGVGLTARPGLRAGLALDRLTLDDWAGAGWAAPGMAARSGRFWSQFDGDIHVTAAEGRLHGLTLRDLALDARSGVWGLKVDRATATLSGVTLTAAGTMGTDGVLAGGTVRAVAGEAAALQALAPPALLWAAGLLHGPASMEAILAGPPEAMAVQLRADLGDLVGEAELRADTDRRTAAGSITMRHPGAPRLLASLGVNGAERWLDTGSMALRGQVTLQIGRVSLEDFDLVAADLRLGGSLNLDLAQAEPALRGDIHAEALALPGWTDWAGFGQAWLRHWSAQLHLTADRVTLGGSPAAMSATAEVSLGSGIALLTVAKASVAGGRVSGQVALDTGQGAPAMAAHVEAEDLRLSGPLTGWPIDLAAGVADGSIDAQTVGGGAILDRLAGTATVSLHDARLSGLDAAAARLAAASPGASRPALLAALSHGASGGLAGTANLGLAHRVLRLSPTRLASVDAAVVVQGTADQAGMAMRLDIPLSGASVSQAGPWGSIRAVVDPGAPPRPARPKRRRR